VSDGQDFAADGFLDGHFRTVASHQFNPVTTACFNVFVESHLNGFIPGYFSCSVGRVDAGYGGFGGVDFEFASVGVDCVAGCVCDAAGG